MSKPSDLQLIGAMDQGTSSSRFLIFSTTSALLTYHQIEVPRLCPKTGWVEQDANLLLNATIQCVDKAVDNLVKLGFSAKQLKAIGITNQRETVVAWDKYTGEAVYNAIVWMDTRTSDLVTQLSTPQTIAKVKKLSGLPISTYFSALKIKWLIENIPKVKTCLEEGSLLVGTVDSWLLWNLTGGKSNGLHLTDVTNASRTMLMNIETLEWDEWLLDFFKIPRSILPAIRSSAEIYGHMTRTSLVGLPISGILGDQQAALVGQMCFRPGQAKCTYGTGCFLLFNTGGKITHSTHGLLTTLAYKLGPNAPPIYALEGSIGVAGGAIRWLRDNLGIASTFEEVDELASQPDDNGGVYFVPAFGGLLAPYWRPDARGLICGLTEHSTRAHLSRAAYEAVTFQVRDLLEAMKAEGGGQLTSLRVDGGMTTNSLLMQLQADVLGIPTIRPEMSETTALGAAMAAGVGVGVWQVASQDVVTEEWVGRLGEGERQLQYAKWKEAVKRACGWAVPPDQLAPPPGSLLLSSIPPSLFLLGTFAILVLSSAAHSAH